MTEPSLPALPESLDGVDDLSSAAFRAFIDALRLHRRLMVQTLADHGFHPGQAMCLRMLIANDGITQRDLARALYVAPPTLTKMLHSMEKAGLVQRRADASDARLTRVELTDPGRALEQRMRAAAAEYVNATIGTLPPGDRRDLTRLLEALSATIEQASATREAGAADPRKAAAP